MSGPFIGPIPYARIPEQPTFNGHCVAWAAFDVPRIWDIVAAEDNPRGWEQVDGFRHLAELLVDHHRRLRRQHFDLTQAWQSPAASAFLDRVATLAESLLSDGHCAQSTAHAMHNIMTTYADARAKVARIHDRWNSVTSDLIPEWWDNAAEELNAEAQAVMVKTDEAVRDHRKRILAPDVYDMPFDNGVRITDYSAEETPTRGDEPTVPPVPGRKPWLENGSDGPALSGAPNRVPFVPAVPGEPISVLPVPPGNHVAPFGGAYILPGPGVGAGGYIVPMPPSSSGPSHFRRGSGPSAPGPAGPSGGRPTFTGGSSGGAGLMPVGITSPSVATKDGGHGPLYRRGAHTKWLVRTGGPAIIDAVDDGLASPEQTDHQDEAFKRWFAELAYPWRSQGRSGGEPHIVLRRLAE